MKRFFCSFVLIFSSHASEEMNIKQLVLKEKFEEVFKSIPINPKTEDLFWIALAYDQSGYFEKALQAYDQYLKEGKDYREEAKERKKEIESLFKGDLYYLNLAEENLPLGSDSLPINLYFSLREKRSKQGLENLPPYLQARLLVELSDNAEKAYRLFPEVWTLEALIYQNPDLAFSEMEKSPALKTPYLLALYYLEKGNPKEADALLSGEEPKILFAKVRALKMLGKEEEAHKTAKKYLQHPDASLQAEVAFSLYSYQDYLFGDKEALKHLSQFVKNYPNHPLVLNGYYLLGLDLKRERRKLHAKNLMDAADAFLEVEHRFPKIAIPASDYSYYLSLKHESSLERAKTLNAIAEEGGETKKKLYSGYALEVLNQLEKEMLTQEEKGELVLLKGSLLTVLDENPSEYLKSMLPTLSPRYKSLANISLAKLNPNEALHYLDQLDDLPMDAKLSAKLIKSEAFEKAGELDLALSTLSEVINENAVSEKRVEAMYKRALIYEKQDRQDLALRQLEACKHKGGEWGSKAAAHLKDKYEQL